MLTASQVSIDISWARVLDTIKIALSTLFDIWRRGIAMQEVWLEDLCHETEFKLAQPAPK